MHILKLILLIVFNFVLYSYGLDLCKGNHAFLFPTEPHSAYPKLSKVPFPDNTKQFAVSMWTYLTNIDSMRPFISYADANQPNIFLFGSTAKGQTVSVKDRRKAFSFFAEINTWWHVTYMWNSDNDKTTFFHNGTLTYNFRYNASHGYTFGGNGFLIPGIIQKTAGKSYKDKFTFRGLITSINVWDRILTREEVMKVYNSEMEGNIVAWSKTIDQYELVGGIKLVNTTLGMRKDCDGRGGSSETTTSTPRKPATATKTTSISKKEKNKNKISVNIRVAQIYDNVNPNVNAQLDTCNGAFQEVNATFQKIGENLLNIVSPVKQVVNEYGKKIDNNIQASVDSAVKVGSSIQNSVKISVQNLSKNVPKIKASVSGGGKTLNVG